MAQHITAFSIVEVAKPNIGESWPARVRADVTVNLNVKDHIKHEWEGNHLISHNIKPEFSCCVLRVEYSAFRVCFSH